MSWVSLWHLFPGNVKTLKDSNMEPGYYEVNWDASSVASGAYFVKLSAGSKVGTQKIMLIKQEILMRMLLLSLGILFASELEVQGNLKVTGTVDAKGKLITNAAEAVLTTDVATANLSRRSLQRLSDGVVTLRMLTAEEASIL